MKPNESNCKEVVDYLRERNRDDAVAMAILKKEYRIIKCDANRDSVLKKPPTQIIQYFDTEEGKVCVCRSKIQRPEPMNMNELYILLAE